MPPKCQHQAENKYCLLGTIASLLFHGYSIYFTTMLRLIINTKMILTTKSCWRALRNKYTSRGAFR